MRGGAATGPRAPRAIALAMLLACALALRMLVPAGWMPVSDARGLHLVPCSGTGPMALPGMGTVPGMGQMPPMIGMAHGDHGRTDQPATEHPCAFSNLHLAIAQPDWPAVDPLPARANAAPIARVATVSIGRGLAAPPPPPTGPPSRA